MDFGSWKGWGSWLLVAAGIVYLVMIRQISRRGTRSAPLTAGEKLMLLARKSGVSEYELFRQAADQWNVAVSGVEKDFKTYLTEGALPYYVNGYIRQKEKEGMVFADDRGHRTGELPP